MSAMIRCDRCRRRYRGHGEWNATARQGVIVGYLCPDCQTPEENAEAEINLATLDYFVGADGLFRGRPKVVSA
ncbi:hypothetical protein [Mycolicibacter kumamotonensis]|uniref:Uncharacterized protein n=1 Tax=Mycolicibacter kumamotonensis TaxID=354243 RepID=A0A7K3LGI3_9MYCO|nr:hypothetical protein [Mycolicibacter kumamotonensis]NDJ91469.1 hypothetical protein [Mycolicibacter kumamotonensis]